MDFAKFKKNRDKTTTAVQKMKDKKPSYSDDRLFKTTPDKQGNTDILMRILPQKDPEKEAIVEISKHTFQENGRWFFENCPNTIKSGNWADNCPVCDFVQPLWDRYSDGGKKKTDLQIASKYNRKKRYICNVLIVMDLGNKDNNGRVMLWEFGKQIYDKIMDKVLPKSELDEPVIVWDMWEGMNFKLKQRKDGDETNYNSSEWTGTITPLAKTDKEMEEIYNKIVDLDEFFDEKLFKSYADLKKKLISVVGAKAAKHFASKGVIEDTGTEVDTDNSASDDNIDAPNTTDDIDDSQFEKASVEANVEVAAEKMIETTDEEIGIDEDEFDFEMDDDELFNMDE